VVLLPADTVEGRVVDNAGQPVPEAIVEITELGTSVTASADGAFRLTLAPGHYTLAVRRPGFAPAVREISVGVPQPPQPAHPSQPPLEIVLAPSAFTLEPVTVTATRQPLSTASSALPATALAGDQLERAQSVSLAHVVDVLPGVRAITTGAQIGKPVIRGFSGARVLVLENGSRLEDYSWSDEDGPSVETEFVRRVELIRGPASVLYGSDALGGVINVIPAQLPDAGGGGGGGPGFVRSGYIVSAATNNTEVAAGAKVEGARGNLGWRIDAIGHGSSNLHTPAGELDNTGFGSFNGEAAAGWRWPTGSALAVRVIHYGGEFKLLEANAPPGETGGPERKLGDERVQITGQRPMGSWRLEAKGQLQRHSLIEVSDDSTGHESEAFNLLLQTGSLDLLAHRGGGTFGVTTNAQRNDASGRVRLVPNAGILSGAAFAFEQWRPHDGRWTFLAGARVDARRLSVERNDSLGTIAQDRNSQALSGNAGVVFSAATGLSLSLNVGRAWRAPTLFELFANGPHLGEARYEQGDSTLKPETSRGLDVGVRWTGQRTRLEFAAYHNRMSAYIYITPTAVFIDSLRVYRYGQAEAEMFGGEALVEAEIAPGFVARGRVEVVRGTNLTAHEPLPLLPPRRATLGLGWRDRFTMDVDAYARPDRPNPLDIPTAGYALVHLGGRADVRVFGRAMRLDISLRNALNQRYRSFLSRYKEFALDPGRNLIVRISSGYVD
jgi:iron complex outermembrane recepter protein